jgi:uncharacterized protein YkwD
MARTLRLLTSSTLAGLAVLAVAAPGASAGACPGAQSSPADLGVDDGVDVTLCLLNDQRGDRGLRPLRLNSRLAAAARGHSRDMVARGYFSHTGPGGVTFDRRLRRTGYVNGARPWTIGENIAWGSGSLATPSAIVRAWMNSPGHRRNILDGAFEEIGIGIALGTPVGRRNGGTYTTDFGARS